MLGFPKVARFSALRNTLKSMAVTCSGTRILGLFVDGNNKRAIKFYEQAGFIALPAGGKKYLRMYLYLRESPAPSR